MKALLLSIKPEYVEKILDGSKKWEYRRVAPRLNMLGMTVYIYATAPVKKIIAVASLGHIYTERTDVLFEQTGAKGGITREAYDRYFKRRFNGHALRLNSARRLEPPLELADVGLTRPPQSFCYIDEVNHE